MYQFTMPKEVTENLNNLSKKNRANSNVQNLLDEINKINNKYSSTGNEITTPDKVEFTELEFKNKTKEEIENESKSMLEGYKNESINKINSEYKNKENDLLDSVNPLKESAKVESEKVKNLYNNAKEATNNDAIRRGLARSSIVFNQINAFNEQELNDYKKINEELTDKINAISFELEALGSAQQEALNNFNIEYASKLSEKISQLEKELKKEEQEVIKYNNEIRQKEQQFNNDIAEFIQKSKNDNFNKDKYLMEFQAKYGANVINNIKSADMEMAAGNLFNNMSKNDILSVLEDENVINALGAQLIKKLKTKYVG